MKEELRFILFSVSSLFKSMLNSKIIFIISCLVIYSSAAQINGFVIVDTRSNKEVMEIVDKMAIDLKQNPAIGIIAKTDDDTKTVKFTLDGINPYRIETVAPFSLQGDSNGQIFPVNLIPGSHKLSAIPTSNSTSLDGKEIVINFEIVDSIGKGLLRIGYFTYELVNSEDQKIWKQLSNADFTSAPERYNIQINPSLPATVNSCMSIKFTTTKAVRIVYEYPYTVFSEKGYYNDSGKYEIEVKYYLNCNTNQPDIEETFTYVLVDQDSTCGNGICDKSETCLTCPNDCGKCKQICGDGICYGNENCTNCEQDCGECKPICGDNICSITEDCNTCAMDCGECKYYCGDGSCSDNENCTICSKDCGECAAVCGDGICSSTESCLHCAEDCGKCPENVCGDKVCNGNESCSNCPKDCGYCITSNVTEVANDGICSGTENCKTASGDCGECATECDGDYTVDCSGSNSKLNCVNCPQCTCSSECGNNICEMGENSNNCPQDCSVITIPECKNGLCEITESCSNCPGDCGECPVECGDGVCNNNETCTTCSKDCGECDSVCGDGICARNEDCKNCTQDCGECKTYCGDKQCNGDETCKSCPIDCDICPPVCGDGACNTDENCTNCEEDCGECPAECGDGKCNGDETCRSCSKDCGECPVVCGDRYCDYNNGENCTTCTQDCGICLPNCGNGVCEESESCNNCPSDCNTAASKCPQNCGDGKCSSDESCSTCPKDCGLCATYTCDSLYCSPPQCTCAKYSGPSWIPKDETPQFVSVTWDDAQTLVTFPEIIKVSKDRSITDALGCPIKFTFYDVPYNTNYKYLTEAYADGHEIAQHTVSHGSLMHATKADWEKELTEGRRITSQLSVIPDSEIVGLRAPFLVYTNAQFEAMIAANYTYDSSMTTGYKGGDNYHWPFTLEYGSNMEHWTGEKPSKSYPGLWEIPMHTIVRKDGTPMDSMDYTGTYDELLEILKYNFDLHYNGNRAPFGMFFHGAWMLTGENKVKLLQELYKYFGSKKNTVFATSKEIIDWMKNPTPLSQMSSKSEFQCPKAWPTTASSEICDGIDNDLNGVVDDGNVLKKCYYSSINFETCYSECPKEAPGEDLAKKTYN